MRLEWLLAAAVAVAVAVALLASSSGGSASGGGATAPSPRAAATGFANAYLTFLDGRISSSALPSSTAAAQSQAGPSLTRAQRFGALTLHRLELPTVSGAPAATALFVGRDARGHGVSVQIGLVYRARHWQVVKIVAPDLATAFKTRHVPGAAAPTAARTTAALFARAYLDWVQGATQRRPAGGPAVARQLRNGTDPLHSLHPTHRRAQLLAIELGPPAHGSVDAIARFAATAGGSPQTFAFVMSDQRGRWQVTELVPGSLGVRT